MFKGLSGKQCVNNQEQYIWVAEYCSGLFSSTTRFFHVYGKYKFCVYFGIEISIISVSNYCKIPGIAHHYLSCLEADYIEHFQPRG